MSTFLDYAKAKSKEMRTRRFRRFEELADRFSWPLRILDVGGTNEYWEMCGWAGRPEIHITAVNLAGEEKRHENIDIVAGDATDLGQYGDGSFDIAFSNSVIEHLFTRENQVKMAREMVRVGRAYYCQTPNYWFPMEPHFHFPGWQWLPVPLRVAILRRRDCGFRPRTPDREAALESVREIRLIGRRELRRLFPEAELVAERFLGLTKSWTAIGGFPPATA
jgi:hypothetical protein